MMECDNDKHFAVMHASCFDQEQACLGTGKFCDGCACVDCGNTEENVNEVHKRRHKVNVKNPHAFQDKKVCPLDDVASLRTYLA